MTKIICRFPHGVVVQEETEDGRLEEAYSNVKVPYLFLNTEVSPCNEEVGQVLRDKIKQDRAKLDKGGVSSIDRLRTQHSDHNHDYQVAI